MDAGGNFANNFALYLMMTICAVLVALDSIEIYRLSNSWAHVHNWSASKYEDCIKNELITKTVFAAFSLLSGIAALLLTIFLVISVDYFINKIFAAYLNMVYSIFGPLMLGFSLLGLINWNEVVFTCDRNDPQHTYFSLGSSFSLIGCFMISLFITITFATYGVVNMYISSILGREGQNKFVRTCFWWVVMRARPNITGNNSNNNQAPQNNEGSNEDEERIQVDGEVNRI
jgi:hypothetical protein